MHLIDKVKKQYAECYPNQPGIKIITYTGKNATSRAEEYCGRTPTCWGFTEKFGNNLGENKGDYRFCYENAKVYKSSHSNLHYCKHVPDFLLYIQEINTSFHIITIGFSSDMLFAKIPHTPLQTVVS